MNLTADSLLCSFKTHPHDCRKFEYHWFAFVGKELIF